MKRWPLIRVTWLDSSSHNAWTRLDVLREPYDMTHDSVGWLIHETDDRVTLAAHVQTGVLDNPAMEGSITIPKVAITERWVLIEADA